jgi:hypothetical protein
MVSGSERYAEYGAVAGAHRLHTGDLTSKKMSPDGFSCKQYYAPISNPQPQRIHGEDRYSSSLQVLSAVGGFLVLPNEPFCLELPLTIRPLDKPD